MRHLPTLAGGIALLIANASLANAPEHLLRLPDIHGQRIAFVHAGDIYTVAAGGGTALRLTSHEGDELYPKFSPDGNRIAFSAEYNGTRQVYVMPAGGGTPTQLTWYNDVGPMPPRGGTDYRVLDWTPDGRNILVRANRAPTDERSARPFLVPADGGMEQALPVPETGGGMLSPDGTQYVYTPIDREFRTWKRHRGGRAQDVWIFDLEAITARRLTDHPATDNQPMWVGDTIYFTSDRDYTLNLFALPADGGAPRKVTAFDDYDVLWPSAGPDAIVFEKGGAIWHLDPASNATREVPIRIVADAPATLANFVDAAKFVESFDIAPDGSRAVLGARGEVFTVPAKQGEPRNISRSGAAREHSVSWSPDGRHIAFLSDASGEYEVYIQAQDGASEPRRLTRDGDIWRFAPVWSPDSRRLAFADKRQRLMIVDVAGGDAVEVDRSTKEDVETYLFSPDSRALAYLKSGANNNSSIWVYSIENAEARQLSGDATSETAFAFDPGGRYLYFLSNRDYNLAFSSYEFDYLYNNASRVYAATLAADGPPLYPAKSDEVTMGAAADDDDKDEADGKPPARVRIDIPGFEQRVVAMKAPAGNYFGLTANADGVFMVSAPPGGGGAELQYLALDGDKPETVSDSVSGYALSADGKKLLLRRGERFAIVDAKPKADFDKGALDLSRMQLRVEPKTEWQQMYVDAWRILRDWFYDPGMHGQDWQAIRAKYQPLVDAADTRADIDYVFSELAGELNAGHVYVESGDAPAVTRRAGGLLGAEVEAVDGGSFRIRKIFAGDNWNPALRSPLTEPGIDVEEGDYIIAVDNVPARSVKNFYQLLENRADQIVTLRVSDAADGGNARDVRVKTISSEQSLRYRDWVDSRRRLVDQLSDGRIGYIHVPNTAVDGNRELFRGMLAYGHKEALIIDDRYNGGGFIPDRMIELLSRQPLNYWKRRGLDPNATPLLHHRGPKAMLINGQSSSGGDALPYYFRKLGLGKLIGTRTWGGLIGISGNPRLADGGAILAATFRFLDTDGRWAVENEGVSPDIEVIDRPDLVAKGRDPSIETAVRVLLDELREAPVLPVQVPPAPVSFD